VSRLNPPARISLWGQRLSPCRRLLWIVDLSLSNAQVTRWHAACLNYTNNACGVASLNGVEVMDVSVRLGRVYRALCVGQKLEAGLPHRPIGFHKERDIVFPTVGSCESDLGIGPTFGNAVVLGLVPPIAGCE